MSPLARTPGALARPTLLFPLSFRSAGSAAPKRSFTQSQARKGGAPEYDPPTGWLFGRRPGEKRVKEGWENIFYIGYVGSAVLATIAYAFKPDTSIQTWALEEARRRLEAEGILPDPDNEPKA